MFSNNDNDDVMIMIIPLCRTGANTFEDKMCVVRIEKVVLAT